MQETLIFDGSENHGFLQMFPSTCSKMVEQNPNQKKHIKYFEDDSMSFMLRPVGLLHITPSWLRV